MSDYNEFYIDAKQLMYNPVVNQYFGFTTADSQRYGNSAAPPRATPCWWPRRC